MDETTVQQNVPLILVVDDDKVMRRLVRRVLERRGYAVEEAADGAQALSAFERLQPDVVLLDITMPEMDGFASLARLRALPGGDRTPVLMITALDDKASVDRAFEAGATDYITKPIHWDVLYHRMRNLLRARQAEEALQESEERFRTFFESAPIGIYRTTPDGRLLLANPAAIRMLGYDSFEELAALDLEKESHQIGYSRREFRERIERDGEIRGLETEWTTKGNSMMIVRENARVVRDGNGAVLYYEGTLEDITERRHLEEQMWQQDRMTALGRLAGGIAHDFNNILTGITLSAQMLLGQRHLPSDLTPDLESILDDARQAARLVQQILDFSRRSFFEIRSVDLRLITGETADLLRRTLPENIHFLLEVGRGECVVNADPERMQQVLTNLALNARDAMPEGGELRIGLSRAEVRLGEEPPVEGMPPGEWVCLAVSDTGKGIPPEAMPRLFEPFFTTKPVGQGTGMGLAQAHGIVKQHEGYIGVETEVGQGTTFRVYLPAQSSVETEEAPLGEVPSAIPEQEGETILLVEDEKKVRKFGRMALELLGYRVLTAANGREALEVYRSAERAYPEQGRGIDLVLADMVMPEMGGRELMRELRKENPHLKAVVMTGYTLEEDLRELMEEGIVDVIHKPFDLGTLEEVIRHALDGD
jgi:PAS domain S-box-containing protein